MTKKRAEFLNTHDYPESMHTAAAQAIFRVRYPGSIGPLLGSGCLTAAFEVLVTLKNDGWLKHARERNPGTHRHKLMSGATICIALGWPWGAWFEDGVTDQHYGSEEQAAKMSTAALVP